ncbi:MAG: FtsX-like permease family protein [Acidimicrobiia bacterium]|nr:FtsX-like permease family protein [Acidimicrobiia bacterium]
MTSLPLLMRWSWRDLRAHWTKVLAIALVIAIGTGGYAGLTSNANIRRASYDASFEALAMYDLRVELPDGSFAPEGSLAAAVDSIEHHAWVDAIEERLIVPTQIDASHGETTVLARSEITGTNFADGGPAVNGYHTFTGRLLDATDAGSPRVMIERNFATFYDLPATGSVEISGDRTLEYVAQASTPEYYAVAPEGEILLSEANFGALFTTLGTAQMLSGHDGEVNDAVLTLVADADRDVVQEELRMALAALGIGAEVTTRDDNLAYSALTTDVDNDQQMFNALAFLLFAGAVGAAFNLIHRLAEQQRREIGISMALGVTPRHIAIRPVLISAQIAFLGVVFGVGMGMLISAGFQGVLEDFVPLPIWDTAFQFEVFAGAAAIGFLVPFVATFFPIWKAVRITPVEAIRPPHLVTKPGSDEKRRSMRARTFTVMPFRNMLRAKRRTAFTTLGIAAIVTVLVAFLGIVDSFVGTIDAAEAEATTGNEDRIVATLDGFYPVSAPDVQSIATAASVDRAEPTLRVGAIVMSDSQEFDILIEFLDPDGAMWSPTITAGAFDSVPGVVLAEKAAADLGVGVGDDIVLRHPMRTGMTTFELVDTTYPVLGLHPYPIRTFAYMDAADASTMGLTGVANLVQIDPLPGTLEADVQRELFEIDAVASVQSVTGSTDAIRDQLGAMLGIVQIMGFIVLLLALLIAFNTASINLDARAREHATMFAYGIRIRTALRMAITESLVIGIAATVLGVMAGLLMLTWMTQQLIASTLPEFGMEVILEPATLIAIAVLGILAVAIAPVFTVRKMRRMDLPGTLRLVE